MKETPSPFSINVCASYINDKVNTVADPGEGPGGPPTPPPLFLNQTEAQRAKKIFFKTRPTLSQGVDDRALPLSEGLHPPLEYNNVPPLNKVSQSENALNGIYQR